MNRRWQRVSRMWKRWGGRSVLAGAVSALALVACCLTIAGPLAAQPRTPAAQDEFVPVKDIPPEDQLPAAPLLIAAYAVAWLAIGGYAWLLWRQLGRVERELQALNARLASRGH